MTPLSPQALQLLDFLCDMHSRRIRVKSLKRFADAARRDQLQEAGLLFAGTCEPTPWALADWTERQQTKSEAAPNARGPEEPPEPEAADDEGGADARKVAAPPDTETHELPDEPVAEAAGVYPFTQPPLASPKKHKRNTRGTSGAHGRGRERAPEGGKANGPVQQRKRRTPDTVASTVSARQREETPRSAGCAEGGSGGAKPIPDEAAPTTSNTQGASGTPDQDPSASSLGDATRIKDRAPIEEPAGSVAPAARARPVDIKVNAEPAIAAIAPCAPANERKSFQRQVQRALRTNRENAAAFLDSGKTSADAKSVTLRIEARKLELQRIDDARLLDPVEQAKTVIRQGGWRCFSAIISGGPADHYYIGNRVVAEPELLAFAERLRTSRARRAG